MKKLNMLVIGENNRIDRIATSASWRQDRLFYILQILQAKPYPVIFSLVFQKKRLQ